MARIVSNATPLIYLAKIGKLELLRGIFTQVLIPEEVKEECVDRGKDLGQADAFTIEKAIEEGWIKVVKIDSLESPIKLEAGEIAAISLAVRKGVKEILIDEAPGRTAARLFGLKPRGTMFILLNALKVRELDLEEFLDAMARLAEHGFRLREEIYLEAIKKARKMAGSRR